ncbi:MAG: protein translocase subunit SecF [Patescibacteria group bacterium]
MIIPFAKYSKLWVAISGATVVVCSVLTLMWGLKPGIDFTGGTLWEFSFSQNRPAIEDVQKAFTDLNLSNSTLQKTGDFGVMARTSFLTEDQHQLVLRELRAKFQTDSNNLREDRFETIGAAVSKQLRTRALWAIILVSFCIVLYVTYAFRKVSAPVASWKYGVLAIVALIHDILLVMGVFAVLGHFYGVEVDIAFVVALLTVLGYSINDTIIVYDRIRENLLRRRGEDFGETVNVGLNQTLMRSINTTLTTLFPLFILYFFGGASIHNFTLALLIGIASGAYSSVFIASPLLVLVEKWKRN